MCYYKLQFVQNLHEVAENIKVTKESLRIETLKTGLQNIHCQLMEDDGTCLPLSPSKLAYGINVSTCAYFPSFTLPLKINFIGCDNVISPAIFKVCSVLQDYCICYRIHVFSGSHISFFLL